MKNQNVHPSLFAERTSKNIELYNLDKNHPFIKAKKIIRPSNTNIKTFERSKSYNVPSSTRIKNNLFEPINTKVKMNNSKTEKKCLSETAYNNMIKQK